MVYADITTVFCSVLVLGRDVCVCGRGGGGLFVCLFVCLLFFEYFGQIGQSQSSLRIVCVVLELHHSLILGRVYRLNENGRRKSTK